VVHLIVLTESPVMFPIFKEAVKQS